MNDNIWCLNAALAFWVVILVIFSYLFKIPLLP